MSDLKKVKTVFLDYDGTLHDSMAIYAPAFRKAYDYLVSNGLAEKRTWTNLEISKWLGYNPKDMWDTFMPDLEASEKQIASQIIGSEMNALIDRGAPVLYEGALETLEYLKNKGYTLVFISNCKMAYMENHNRLFKLDQYFDAMICSEMFDFIPKHQILAQIMHRFPQEMVIVGDRIHDIESGTLNNIHAIACAYGFGHPAEFEKAAYTIIRIESLKTLL